MTPRSLLSESRCVHRSPRRVGVIGNVCHDVIGTCILHVAYTRCDIELRVAFTGLHVDTSHGFFVKS